MTTNQNPNFKQPMFTSFITFSSTKNTQNSSMCSQSFCHQPFPTHEPQSHQFTRPRKQKQAHFEQLTERYSVQKLRLQKREKQQQRFMTQNFQQSYSAIERILKDENVNLKEQNALLLTEISRLKDFNKKYKLIERKQKIQIEGLKAQCHAHKNRADELKSIAMTRLQALQAKLSVPRCSLYETSLSQVLNISDELRK